MRTTIVFDNMEYASKPARLRGFNLTKKEIVIASFQPLPENISRPIAMALENKKQEQKARDVIDMKLEQAGWVIQDKDSFDRSLPAVAYKESQTSAGKFADYALFLNGTPVGLVEAKAPEEGVHLNGIASDQNLAYAESGLRGYDPKDIRFLFEATDIIVQFTDRYDPAPCPRRIFSFYRPEHLAWLINDYKKSGETLRGRMQHFPEIPQDVRKSFRDCQVEAITKLEEALANNEPRALVQMATAAGKTFAAITSSYRLLKHAEARRVLFLVDTNNLGAQAQTAYDGYKPYDSDKTLSETYRVRRIRTSNIPDTTIVCISTIQRLYSMLTGEIENFAEGSDDEMGSADVGGMRTVVYNKEYPPEFFDVIFIDECHRSIYHKWRAVLEYFDAFLVGLTATPHIDTYGFFQKVVSEYTHEDAVRDGVNVGAFGTFVIRTAKTQDGGVVPVIEQKIEVRDKRTRQQKWKEADEELPYKGSDLNNSVLNRSTIRLILETFRDNWKKWIYFQDREELPKTLIFAEDDSHASDIVEIARMVFGKGSDFCKKITYKSEENEETLLKTYRNKYNPRIAVTVSKIATGTDVPVIEILVFMRNIRDANYYEQMLGRARRVVTKDKLRQTSPSANSDKLGYVIVDAAGITDSEKVSRGRGGGDMRPSVSFKRLVEAIALYNDCSEESFSSLGERIERMSKVATPEEHKTFEKLSGDISIHDLAYKLKNAHNPDEIEAELKNRTDENTTESEKARLREEIVRERCIQAATLLYKPEIRQFLTTFRNSNEQTIDPTFDSLRVAKFSEEVEETNATVRKTFRDFIDEHRDEVDALQIIYSQEFRNRHITEEMIHELYSRMAGSSRSLTQTRIFSAYADKTKRKTPLRELVDIIQIIRYEWQQVDDLAPFADGVRNRYKTWIFAKNKNKKGSRGVDNAPFTKEQLAWLEMIRDHIAMNASIQPEALNYGNFARNGGAAKYCILFGAYGEGLLEELNEALVA